MTSTQIRDLLGRASHAHLREVLPESCQVPDWHDLSESGRESYRRQFEWLVPTFEALLAVEAP